MSQPELLKKVIQSLDHFEIPYMITGSVVSSLQGEPRSTHDIDIVVAIHQSDAKKLLTTFTSPGYYLDEGSILEAIDSDGMFNLIEVNSGDKVDFWVLTGEVFDRSRFSRRISVAFISFCTYLTMTSPLLPGHRQAVILKWHQGRRVKQWLTTGSPWLLSAVS